MRFTVAFEKCVAIRKHQRKTSGKVRLPIETFFMKYIPTILRLLHKQAVLSSIAVSFYPREYSCQTACYHYTHVKKDSVHFSKMYSFDRFIWQPPAATYLKQP